MTSKHPDHEQRERRWSLSQVFVRVFIIVAAIILIDLLLSLALDRILSLGNLLNLALPLPITIPLMVYLAIVPAASFEIDRYKIEKGRNGAIQDSLFAIITGAVPWYIFVSIITLFDITGNGLLALVAIGLLIMYFGSSAIMIYKNSDYYDI